MQISENSPQEQQESTKDLFRGIWVDYLEDNQEIFVGGEMNDKLTQKLNLDFSTFDKDLENFTPQRVKDLYEEGKDSIQKWLDEEAKTEIAPYTYFMCYHVQSKITQLLKINPEKSNYILEHNRKQIYKNKGIPKLSELKGEAACAERAALGQYLLQKLGLESAYVSGITMRDAKDEEELPSNHSFIVLKHPTKPNSSLIFDIARPHKQHNMPKLFETDVPFNYELLKDKNNLLIEGTEILLNSKRWFGVGRDTFGKHNTLEDFKQTA